MKHRIKEIIKEQGYTQQQFAEKLGMSRIGLSQILNGNPSAPTLEKIADALGVPPWQLLVSPDEATGFVALIRYKGKLYSANSIEENRAVLDKLSAQ